MSYTKNLKEVFLMREDYQTKCKRCGATAMRSELSMSYDCHGIPFRLVCYKCSEEIDEIGFDGVPYSSSDENIDKDY
jgi:hypothetical protein